MKRNYCTALTREMLEDWGFTNITYTPLAEGEQRKFNFDEKLDWVVMRNWWNNSHTLKKEKRITITEAVCKHKFTKPKKYLKITFSVGSRVYTIPLARIIYAWFIGPVPEGYVVDHIDNNAYHNHWKNLQLLTIKQNNHKRFEDNKEFCRNQYETEVYKLVSELFKQGISYEEALDRVLKFKNAD